MIPWYYKALAALLLLGAIFGTGYWKGYKRGTKAMAACEAAQEKALADMKEQGKRLDALNTNLATIAAKQEEAVTESKAAADAARASGRANATLARSLVTTDCEAVRRGTPAVRAAVTTQWRGPK